MTTLILGEIILLITVVMIIMSVMYIIHRLINASLQTPLFNTPKSIHEKREERIKEELVLPPDYKIVLKTLKNNGWKWHYKNKKLSPTNKELITKLKDFYSVGSFHSVSLRMNIRTKTFEWKLHMPYYSERYTNDVNYFIKHSKERKQ